MGNDDHVITGLFGAYSCTRSGWWGRFTLSWDERGVLATYYVRWCDWGYYLIFPADKER